MKEPVSAKRRTDAVSSGNDSSRVGLEVSKVGMGIIWIMGALIGVWGIACFIGGLVAAGGPTELLSSWVAAITGK